MKPAILVLVGMLALGAAARAEPAASPWAEGVPADTQARANALFAEGNALFAQQAHAAALAKYRAAVALWDHPMIQFNMAVTLIRLDRLLEADAALARALRYGPAPFTPDLYRQALDYQKLVGGRISVVEASCTQRGARVLLDGVSWFACPGTQRRRVLAGEHTILAAAPGFMPVSRKMAVLGGTTAEVPLSLVSVESVVRVEYPTPRWVPWTTAGAGAAIGFGGLAVWLAGKSELTSFDESFAMTCQAGCRTDLADQPMLKQMRDGADRKGEIGVAMGIAGGVVGLAGVVWAVLDRPHRVVPAVEPVPGRGAAIGARWRF